MCSSPSFNDNNYLSRKSLIGRLLIQDLWGMNIMTFIVDCLFRWSLYFRNSYYGFNLSGCNENYLIVFYLSWSTSVSPEMVSFWVGPNKCAWEHPSVVACRRTSEWEGEETVHRLSNVPEDRVDCIWRHVYSVTKFTWIHCVHCSWSSKLLTCFDVGQWSSDLVRIKLIDSTNNNPQVSVVYSRRIMLFAPVGIQWVTFHMFIQGSKLLLFCGFFSFMVLST